jgi:CBS domain-containing protein
MKITEIPEFKDKKELLILKSTETVEAAAKQMTKYNYGATVVVDNELIACFKFLINVRYNLAS